MSILDTPTGVSGLSTCQYWTRPLVWVVCCLHVNTGHARWGEWFVNMSILDTPAGGSGLSCQHWTRPPGWVACLPRSERCVSVGLFPEASNTSMYYAIKTISYLARRWNITRRRRNPEVIPEMELDKYLAMFVLSIKKSNGQDYEPDSLVSKYNSVGGYLREKRKLNINHDTAFNHSRDVLSKKCKQLKDAGKGAR